MAEVVRGVVVNFDGSRWQWCCGKCHARTNEHIEIKGSKTVNAACKKCGSINMVNRKH